MQVDAAHLGAGGRDVLHALDRDELVDGVHEAGGRGYRALGYLFSSWCEKLTT